jgi:hypothetical protein
VQVLKADTAVKVVIGPVVAVGDGFTPVTTLAVSTADEAELMKHDAASVTDISGNTFAAIASMDGYYNLTITAGQLDTEGMVTVGINDDSLCLPVVWRGMVVNANVYDSLYAAATTDYLQVDVEQVDGDATAAANLNSACDNYSATRGLAGTALPGVAADGAGGLPISDLGGLDLDALNTAAVRLTAARAQVLDDWINAGRLDAILDIIAADVVNLDGAAMRGTDSAALASVCTEARLAELAAANLPADIDAILADTSVLGKRVTLTGTANAGDTTTQITLTGGVATDQYYNGQLVVITGGTGIGQARTVLSYTGSTAVAVPTRDWVVAPNGTSTFVVIGADEPGLLEAGVAQAGANATITLDAAADGANNTYKSALIMITGGTGAGQTRLITAYNGTTKIATVVPNWTTNPAAGSIYQVIPFGYVDVGQWLGEVATGDGDWAALKAETAAILVDTGTTLPATLSTIAGYIDTEVAAIKAVTDALPDAGALTSIGTDTARLTAARAAVLTDWIDGGRLDLLLDAVKAITDALGATAAANLAKSMSDAGLPSGAAIAGTLSTTQMTTNLTEATDDHYIGRTVIWTSGVLLGQASDITDYAGATKLLTYTAVTEAPSATDTFIIV